MPKSPSMTFRYSILFVVTAGKSILRNGIVINRFRALRHTKTEASLGKNTGSKATSVVPGIEKAQPLTKVGEYINSITPAIKTIIASVNSSFCPCDMIYISNANLQERLSIALQHYSNHSRKPQQTHPQQMLLDPAV